MIISIDFDGTCVTHDFPEMGKDIGAVPVLKRLVDNGHKLLLFTMRSNGDKFPTVLTEAEQWFVDNDIELWAVQKNPTQHHWTSSPKAYSHLMIDDAALGIPLKRDEKLSDRDFVDWGAVEILLEQKGLI